MASPYDPELMQFDSPSVNIPATDYPYFNDFLETSHPPMHCPECKTPWDDHSLRVRSIVCPIFPGDAAGSRLDERFED